LDPEKARRVLETADLVCPSTEISAAVARLAREISAALADESPLVLCVMRGAVVFAGQLLPQLRFPLELDYLDVTRYGAATRGGDITWNVAPRASVAGRTVLVVDDILDEGHTLAAVREKLESLGAKRVLNAVLAVKDIARPRQVSPDFAGVTLPDRYVFGYGMDVRGAWRNLPDIYALREEA
jgi:hypoxanthine phosphoribosyltransferase